MGQVFRDTIPVMTGYIFLGLAFGILMQGNGYNALWSGLVSLVVYAGSMQFVLVGLLTSAFNLPAAILMTLSVNARHLFYGLSMITRFRGLGRKKPYLIFALSDETYSLLCAKDPPAGMGREAYYFRTALLNQGYWVLGSVLGGLFGSLVHFNTTGIDFAMTALFVVIFVEQWESAPSRLPAVAGVLISVGCVWLFGADSFIIPAMLVILLLLFMLRGRIERGQSNAS